MNGELLVCEGQPARLTRTNMKTWEVTVVASQFKGKALQSLNDLDFDSSGRIFFSSRTSEPDLQKENKRSVYRVDPDGKMHQLLTEPQVHMPNGIVVSPDEKILYLIEAHGEENHNRNILAFDLHEDGSISNRRVLYDFYPGRSGDGMCIDLAGNLYVAAGLHQRRGSSETLDTRPGIHVISPEGKLLAFRETPEDTITNCTFGGEDLKTLFVTCGSYLLSIRTKIPGKKSYKPDF
jgi:gluconolactonase